MGARLLGLDSCATLAAPHGEAASSKNKRCIFLNSMILCIPAAERTVTLKKSPDVVLREDMVCFFNRSTPMTEVRWERYPSVAQLPDGRSWLQIQGNLGLASIM